MNQSEIESFWEQNPCGEAQVGGLDHYRGEHEAFFAAYDALRYLNEPHILRCLDAIDLKGKRVLEVGLGLGADAEQLIRRGAKWSGVDVTAKSIERVQARLHIRNLPFEHLKQGSALAIPFADHAFDVIFSHGVLHHVPEIQQAQRELWRVLKPEGELIVMLYARWSLNYLLSISLLRRFGLLGVYLTGRERDDIYGQHLANARSIGLFRYLREKNWIHRNTDGPHNPYSKVYDVPSVRRDFPSFSILRAYKQHRHAPPLPVAWLPFERMLGWHLWVHMRPLAKSACPTDSGAGVDYENPLAGTGP